jgi:hypothetical protein
MTAVYLPGQMDLPETEPSEHQWMSARCAIPLKPSKPQLPCDVGLFSDDAAQTDLIDYLKGGRQ